LAGKKIAVAGYGEWHRQLTQSLVQAGAEVIGLEKGLASGDSWPALRADAILLAPDSSKSIAGVLEQIAEAASTLPVIVMPADEGADRTSVPKKLDVYFAPCRGDAEEYVLQLLGLLFDRERLLNEKDDASSELSSLHAGLHQMVADKVREVSTLKDQLSAMFVAVPDVLSAATVEEKLTRAAAALTAPNFFGSCIIVFQDADIGWRSVAAGGAKSPDDPEKEYQRIVGQLGNQLAAVVTSASSGTSEKVLLVPLRGGEGQLLGAASLSASAETFPAQRESLALVELFLDEVMQSVEHFRLERHLEQSEASYRLLIDNVSDVIFRLDEHGKFTFVSRRVQDILGLTWKQILGRHFLEFMHESDAESAERRFAELIAGRSTTQDLRILRPDGKEIIAYVSVDPIVERGMVTGALGVARDVTEKRKLEMQIAESERKYRRLTENAYDAIFLVDADTFQIVDVNPRAEEITGYARDELLNMPMFRLRQSDQWEGLRARIEEVMRTGMGRYEDAPLIRKDGVAIDVETAASALELENKRYYHAIVRDVSENRHMTAELNQRVMELQILAEVSDALQSSIDLDSVMGIVLAGVTAGAGLGFNRAFILSYDQSRQVLRGEAGVGPGSAEEAGRIWKELAEKGLSLADILRRKALSVVAEDDTAAHLARELLIPLDEEHEVFSTVLLSREAMVIHADHNGSALPRSFMDRYRAREFALVPLITRDDVIGVMLVDNLVTGARIEEEHLNRLKLFANSAASAIERGRLLQSLEKRLHELTFANRELKESRDRLVKTERLSAIGEVAASVAHEIRNPLVAIGGFARSVFQSLTEEDRNKNKVKVIVEETDRLERILSGLLEFSRPSLPRFTDVDLNSLVLQTVHFMDAEIDDNLVHITYDLDAELPRVWADTQQMRQVLLNLIRNAVQAMVNGGTVTFRTGVHQQEVRLSIEDTGPGIPSEQTERIFDAFFTTKPTGSGLGLAICTQIVRNHNGRISVESGRIQGAKFVISLPMAQKSA
jgi:hypothetical protein